MFSFHFSFRALDFGGLFSLPFFVLATLPCLLGGLSFPLDFLPGLNRCFCGMVTSTSLGSFLSRLSKASFVKKSAARCFLVQRAKKKNQYSILLKCVSTYNKCSNKSNTASCLASPPHLSIDLSLAVSLSTLLLSFSLFSPPPSLSFFSHFLDLLWPHKSKSLSGPRVPDQLVWRNFEEEKRF